MLLARFSHDSDIPDEAYRSRTFRDLENTASDFVCLLNDVFSYQKEIQFEADLHNAVLVVQHIPGCDRHPALRVVNGLMTARMQQFERIVAEELPALCALLNLDERTRTAIAQRVTELQDWMAGIHHWHRSCDRYREPALLRRFRPDGRLTLPPTGLGTSAARIAESR